MKKIIITIVLLVVIAGGVFFYVNSKGKTNMREYADSLQVNSNASTTIITMGEVAKHNQKTDCWMVINGEVANVTGFVDKHPGGEVIVQGCGKDATEMFNGVNEHMKPFVKALYQKMVVGRLQN